MSTIFKKIVDGELPADKVHEDEHCVAFRDINPVAPTHVLVVPRKELARVDSATEADQWLLGHLLRVAGEVAKSEGLVGYRLVINNGQAAGQTVHHLHVHVIGGRVLAWPPG
jgi:histidine triad (HIT) family protein